MKCVNCSAEIAKVRAGPVTRCLNCGTLLSRPPTSVQAAAALDAPHCYTTPFGKLVARIQPSGSWGVVTKLEIRPERKTNATSLVQNLLNSWRDLDHPALPKLNSFDEVKLRCTWVLPNVDGMVPLAHARPPLAQRDVRMLITSIAELLARVHSVQLGVFDLSPSVVFATGDRLTATLVPTPWLASLAHWAPGHMKDMHFAAPELDRPEELFPDLARADAYALGALARYLLTGEARTSGAVTLSSEHITGMDDWEAFVDGCCRTRPERRFSSLTAALDVLSTAPQTNGEPPPGVGPVTDPPPTQVPVTQGSQTRRPGKRGHRKPITIALLVLLVLGLLAAYSRRDRLVPLIPGVGHLLAKHQRGHGDTILRYEDRSYEGAAWKRVQDTDALKVGGFDLIRLTGIAGWDARSFWVVGTGPSSAAVIHYDDGHWSTGIKYRFAPYSIQRAVARDTLILAGGVDTGYGGGTLHKVDPTGLVDYGHVNLNSLPRLDSQEICLIAPDLFYYFTSDRHGTVVKIAGDKRSDMSIDKYKELLVHRKDNVPLKEYPVSDVRLTRTCKVGHALGVFSPKGYGESLLVDYRDGIWYALLVLGRHGLQDMWVGLVGDQKLTVVCVGQDGYVVRIRDCRQSFDIVEQTVPVSGEVTSGRLLKVWGVSLDKYWTMDENGTVWEWLSGRWRVVVRGLYRNDVTFKSAWVSPEGVVLAITQNAVYRLE